MILYSMIKKKIHLLRIGPALTYSWTSLPVTLPFSGCSITILTLVMLKPYKHAVISEVVLSACNALGSPGTSPASTREAFFGLEAVTVK